MTKPLDHLFFSFFFNFFVHFRKVLQKLWSALGTVKRMYLAKTDAGETKGYMFIEFETGEEAEIALKKLNGHVLDVNHTFKVTRFKDFDEVMKAPETFTPKQPEKFEQKVNQTIVILS